MKVIDDFNGEMFIKSTYEGCTEVDYFFVEHFEGQNAEGKQYWKIYCESTNVCGVPIFMVFVDRPNHGILVPKKKISVEVYTKEKQHN